MFKIGLRPEGQVVSLKLTHPYTIRGWRADAVLGSGRHMTRLELLRLLVSQARSNGFEFRRWYTGRLEIPWVSMAKALETLASDRRYYALLFSHEFAQNFWKAGEKMTFLVPSQTFLRNKPDGSVATVTRKGYVRRSGREDAWKYHLRELALQEEPLRYMRRYLRIEDEMEEDG